MDDSGNSGRKIFFFLICIFLINFFVELCIFYFFGGEWVMEFVVWEKLKIIYNCKIGKIF